MQLSLPLADPNPAPRDAVVFVRHRRARRYILRVLSDGTLRVTLPRWGAKREARAFVEANRAWIEHQRARRWAGPIPAAEAVASLRARAARELPVELFALAEQHNVTVRRVSIRNQRSRWGSCSPSGAITLNWRLIEAPAFVREYVMLHELMHRRELNHSRRFWRLVAACCPRFADARRWLRTEGKLLWLAAP